MTHTTTANSSTLIERFSGASSTTSTNNVLPAPKSSNDNKRPPIIIYPTVTPESIVVPIVSCIFGFPLLALTVICCLRRRAKLARERARRRNCELDRGELSVVRLSPVKSRPRAVSLVRSPRPPPTLELDTVLEERSDPEQTTLSQVDITPDRETMTHTTTANSSTLIERFSGASSTTSTNNVLPAPKSSNGNKRPPIIIYPTVTPESIVVPIVSCIFGFPLLALTVICCLRRRAKLARERARRRNCELDRGELSVVRLSPVKSRPRAVSLVRSPRPPPTLELDTVLEERSDPEQTTLSQVDITPDREVGTILFSAIGAVGSAAVTAAACARDS